jgi:methylated-DNA-protein-cysteine methyltransferase-like protein
VTETANPLRTQIYEVVRRIPVGRVATYGQVATLAGLRGQARQVGYALHDLPDGSDVPWHRVVNARGEISLRSSSDAHGEQRRRLEEEGIDFGSGGAIELTRYRWQARPALWE